MRQIHVITPGDHFSPRTGSAIPTVVDGLCRHRPEDVPRPAVVAARGTYADRYDSADVIEYPLARPLRLPRPLSERRLDGALSLAGLPRAFARRSLAPTVGDQRGWEPSVVLAHNAPQLIPLVDASRHVPVLYAHNHLLRTYRERESRRIMDAAAAVICVSEFLAGQTRECLPGRLRDRVRVVRNGVDVATFARTQPLARNGPLRVVFVGRMVAEKGADVLVEAVRALGRDDIHLTVIGSSGFDASASLTSYERSVREGIASLGALARAVPFLPRDGVARAMGEADVVVVPSRWPEPFALTVLEGMAAGAAVIGSEVGGIPESLRGVGILVPANDTDALAEALEALADDEALLRAMGAACAHHAAENDWRHASRALADVLAGVV